VITRALALILVGLALAACRSDPYATIESLVGREAGPRVLLMPIDLELSEVAAGGLVEPKAAWTDTARTLMTAALAELLAERRATLVPYSAPADDPGRAALHDQLIKLHDTVGEAILVHHYEPSFRLPGKGERLDWSLGPPVALLHHEFDADYALSIFFRDSYKSAGRTAAMAVAAPLSFLGVGLSGGAQVGVASLVDLRTGAVVWFNRLIRNQGELRSADGARESVATLLEGFPP